MVALPRALMDITFSYLTEIDRLLLIERTCHELRVASKQGCGWRHMHTITSAFTSRWQDPNRWTPLLVASNTTMTPNKLQRLCALRLQSTTGVVDDEKKATTLKQRLMRQQQRAANAIALTTAHEMDLRIIHDHVRRLHRATTHADIIEHRHWQAMAAAHRKHRQRLKRGPSRHDHPVQLRSHHNDALENAVSNDRSPQFVAMIGLTRRLYIHQQRHQRKLAAATASNSLSSHNNDETKAYAPPISATSSSSLCIIRREPIDKLAVHETLERMATQYLTSAPLRRLYITHIEFTPARISSRGKIGEARARVLRDKWQRKIIRFLGMITTYTTTITSPTISQSYNRSSITHWTLLTTQEQPCTAFVHFTRPLLSSLTHVTIITPSRAYDRTVIPPPQLRQQFLIWLRTLIEASHDVVLSNNNRNSGVSSSGLMCIDLSQCDAPLILQRHRMVHMSPFSQLMPAT